MTDINHIQGILGRTSLPHKAKFNTARIPACICGGLTKDCVFSNIRTGLEELLQWMKELQQEHAKSNSSLAPVLAACGWSLDRSVPE